MNSSRLDEILRLVEKNSVITVHEISAQMNLHEATVRRDLRKLESQRRIRRRYGSAEVLVPRDGAASTVSLSESSLSIVRRAAALIESGSIVVLPYSAMNLQIAVALRDATHITVITNSWAVADVIRAFAGIHLISLGGVYNRMANAFYGHVTENALREFRADILFLEPSGIDLETGVTYDNIIETSLLKAMIRMARRVVLLLEQEVIGESSGSVLCDVAAATTFVTASPLPNRYEEFAAAQDISVLMAAPNG